MNYRVKRTKHAAHCAVFLWHFWMACVIIFWNNIKRKSDAWTPCGCESCKTVSRIQRSSRCQLYFCDFHKCLYASVGICRHLGGIFFRWDVLQLFCYSEVLSWLCSGWRCRVLREHETAETDESVSLCSVRKLDVVELLCTYCQVF